MESLCVRVPKKAGEKTRRELTVLGAIDKVLKIASENDNLFIPVTRSVEGYVVEKRDFKVIRKEASPADLLGYPPAYEIVGNIAIIDRHEPRAREVAEILAHQKKIKTVLQAVTSVTGEYRTRDVSVLAGERRTETLYRENGCRYLIDIARVYFTPRLSTERMRIAEQVHDGEKVVDMFAGVGPFSILIAKKFPGTHVIAIDKNPDAVYYLRENVKLNKVGNVEIREGDAKEIAKEIKGVDRVIMNLPHSGLEFLEAAFGMIRSSGVIHFYAISHEDELFEGILQRIKEMADRSGFRIIPIDKRMVRPYAPYQYNICIDFRVTY